MGMHNSLKSRFNGYSHRNIIATLHQGQRTSRDRKRRNKRDKKLALQEEADKMGITQFDLKVKKFKEISPLTERKISVEIPATKYLHQESGPYLNSIDRWGDDEDDW